MRFFAYIHTDVTRKSSLSRRWFILAVPVDNFANRALMAAFSVPVVGCGNMNCIPPLKIPLHDNVIKWKHLPRYWRFVRDIHRAPVNSPHKCQWRGALMFSFICTWINGWVNNHEAGDLRRHRGHYDVTVMLFLYDVKLHMRSFASNFHPRWFVDPP